MPHLHTKTRGWEVNFAFTTLAPSLLLSFATILRLICRQKICADSFFRPVEAFAYAAGYVQKRLNSLSRNEENVSIE